MNVRQLHTLLTDALTSGLDPDTAVVVEQNGWFDVVTTAHSPTQADEHSYDLWLTLIVDPGGSADSRFTPGHHQ